MEAPGNDAPFSAESYFATQPPPAELEEAVQGVQEFVNRSLAEGRKVVLITVSENICLLVTRSNIRNCTERRDYSTIGTPRVRYPPFVRYRCLFFVAVSLILSPD